MNMKKILLYALFALCVSALSGFIYLLIPKITIRTIGNLTELQKRFSLYNANIFSIGDNAVFIEQHYIGSYQVVVFGFFADDILTIRNHPEVRDFKIDHSGEPFYLPYFVKENISGEQLRSYRIRPFREEGLYTLVDSDGATVDRTDHISFRIRGSRHEIHIDLQSKRFVLLTNAR